MICAVVAEKTFANAFSSIKKAKKQADFVELRLDYLGKVNDKQLKRLVESTRSLIITCRPKREGGKFTGSEKERIILLRKAAASGAPFIDIEFSTNKNLLKEFLKNKRKSKIILSHHNFKTTLPQTKLKKLLKKMFSLKGVHAFKIVTFAKKLSDNPKVLSLILSNPEKRIIAFCMGRKGIISRIITTKMGGVLTYAPLSRRKTTAPAQLTLKELKKYMGE